MSNSSEEIKAQLRAQMASIERSGYTQKSPEIKGTSESAADLFEEENEEFAPVDDRDAKKEQEAAFRKIERLSLMREQASVALRNRLLREEFSETAVEAALARACACGLVDDVRYAGVLVRSRIAQGRGIQGIEAELKKLDIEASVVEGWPFDYVADVDEEINRAIALLDKKPPRSKNKREAAYRRLAQKGFGASVASTAARLWSESLSA